MHAEGRSCGDIFDFGNCYELLAISLITYITISRMLCRILPNDRKLLKEVQSLAAELKDLRVLVGHSRRSGFYLAQKAKLADAAIASRNVFQEAVGSGKVAEAWRLKRLCEALGRNCCDEETCCRLDR